MLARQFIKPGDPGQIVTPIEIACGQMPQRGKLADQVGEKFGKWRRDWN